MDETRAIIDQIDDDVDVLIGVIHMGLENENGIPNTGVRDLAEVCPEFDLIIAAHQHQLVEGEEVNGVLLVENKYHAQTMACVDLELEPDGNGWKVVSRTSNPVETADYEPDSEIVDLIHEVQLHYTGADVSAVALPIPDASIEPGPILRCDVSQIYKYTNTLYTFEMTGEQLKKHLEWSACFFKTLRPGDLTLSFDPEIPVYCFDTFQGVNYQINVAKEPGERIEGLSWPDGTPVADEDTFVLTTNNYRANTMLLVSDELFGKDDAPKLLETDVRSSIGGIRELIADYIQNVKGGSISPVCDNNWSIVGIDWDEELHQRAVELVADGTLTLSRDDKHLPDVAITEDDVKLNTN